MATRLVQILTFTNVADAATVPQAHNLNIDGVAIAPDFVAGDVAGFAITANSATVSVTNNSGALATIHVYIKREHSIAREIGNLTLTPVPFVASTGGASGGSSPFTAGAGAGSAIQDNGSGNTAAGINAFAANDFSTATGEASFAFNSSVNAGEYCGTEGFAEVEAGCETCHAEGTSTISANTDNAHAEGAGFIGSGSDDAHAEGGAEIGTNAQGAHAEGEGIIGSGSSYSHAEGAGEIGTNAFYSHAEGTSEVGNGAERAHAEGNGTQATGDDSHSQGTLTIATGIGSHAEGQSTRADGDYSHAQGIGSDAFRQSEFAFASGGQNNGQKQNCWLMFRDDGLNGSTSLLRFGIAGTPVLNMPLENNKAYNFTLTAIVFGTQAGPVNKVFTIIRKFNAICVAGVAAIVAEVAAESYGDATAATWVITLAAVGQTLEFTFDDGAGPASACKVAARLEWQELAFA